jgi:hypothetical protein
MVIQHPYGESDQKALLEAGNTGDGAYIGYWGPFKTSDLAGVTSLDMEPVPVPRGDDRHKVSLLSGVSRLTAEWAVLARESNCACLMANVHLDLSNQSSTHTAIISLQVLASNALILSRGIVSDGVIAAPSTSTTTTPSNTTRNSAAVVVGSSLMALLMAALVFLMA